jgi:cytochrome c peroxidase
MRYLILLLIAVLFLIYWYWPTQKKGAEQQTALVTLGHYLFFDPQLSVTGSKSCGSCHNPQFAFTDGYRKTLGVYADVHQRNTPGLVNTSGNHYFNWANTSITSLEQQMEQPLFSHHIPEMGLQENDPAIVRKIIQQQQYKNLLTTAWPNETISWIYIKKALAAYVASLQSYQSPYDRYKQGDTNALNEPAKKGMQLFFSDQLKCSRCHIPPNFGADSSLPVAQQFYNIGLYNLKDGAYASDDNGLFTETGIITDKGKFRVPSLRNLSFTAPYFHDGSAETLQDALQVFEAGGRTINKGINGGDGRKNPYKDKSMSGYTMTTEERICLVNFLLSLDDSTILSNPLFHNPFQYQKN